MNKREVVYLNLEDIKPYENNPRRNDEAIEKVIKSIDEFGFTNPILVDEDNIIIAGHTRYEASKQLELKQVPCIALKNLTEEQIKAYRLIDNKTNEFSSWDYNKLVDELYDIINIDMKEFNFYVNDFEDLNISDKDFTLDEELEEKEKKGKMVKCPHCNGEFEV
ncbi:ParB N-terminal domain-containing protein [Clostridioides difficile]|nr:ParB N-terminal domain-containing protein [Clostridioides difficile]